MTNLILGASKTNIRNISTIQWDNYMEVVACVGQLCVSTRLYSCSMIIKTQLLRGSPGAFNFFFFKTFNSFFVLTYWFCDVQLNFWPVLPLLESYSAIRTSWRGGWSFRVSTGTSYKQSLLYSCNLSFNIKVWVLLIKIMNRHINKRFYGVC